MNEGPAVHSKPETIRVILDRLVLERQRLRGSEGDRAMLEANRISIAYWQAELSAALVAEHGGVLGRR